MPHSRSGEYGGYYRRPNKNNSGGRNRDGNKDPHEFSLSDADFQQSDLKRKRYLSPGRAAAATSSASASTNNKDKSDDRSISFRSRSKSKSRARAMTSKPGQEFFVLGRNESTNTNKASYYNRNNSNSSHNNRSSTSDAHWFSRDRSRSVEANTTASRRYEPESRGRTSEWERKDSTTARSSTSTGKHTRFRDNGRSQSMPRASSKPRTTKKESRSDWERSDEQERSPSVSRKRMRPEISNPQRQKEKKHEHFKSKSRFTKEKTNDDSNSSPSSTKAIDFEVETTKKKLRSANKELEEMQDELTELNKRIQAKTYEIQDLEIVLDGLQKRKQLQQQFLGGESSGSSLPSRASASASSSDRDSRQDVRRSVSRHRVSKRPCIVDEEDDDDDDDDVVIIEPPTIIKQETATESTSTKKSRTERNAAFPVDDFLAENGNELHKNREIPDHFLGKSDIPKLLVNYRVKTISDGSARKGRHLAFNPMKSDVFATSSDDGGLILWNYVRQNKEISRIISLAPTSFRKENPCAESISWSPDGNRMAMAFRDPVDGMGEFCIVRLHQLPLEDTDKPRPIPRDRLMSKSTTLHSRGISAIEWIPSGYGDAMTSRGLVTAGSDHAVVMWEENESWEKGSDLKWQVLHRAHKSEVKSVCMHSGRNFIYTGGLDGLVIRYDMNKFQPYTVIERRKPTISKINAVLEHPHNPNILLVSSVEPSEHNILLHDLREPYKDRNGSTMNLSWVKSTDSRSMSQYIVPRWSPAGLHVSCGSKSGMVNIWDVRVRGPTFPTVQPQQSIGVHHKVSYAAMRDAFFELDALTDDRDIQEQREGKDQCDECEETSSKIKKKSTQTKKKETGEISQPQEILKNNNMKFEKKGFRMEANDILEGKIFVELQLLAEKVDKLENRLDFQEQLQRHEKCRKNKQFGANLSGEHDQLIEFFVNELEKHRSITTKLSKDQTQLQEQIFQYQQDMRCNQDEQERKMRKFLGVMQQMEKEFVRGSKLRNEEKQLAWIQQKKQIQGIQSQLENQLVDVRNMFEYYRNVVEDKFENKFVDLVMENQVLRAENLELKAELEHVSTMAKRNKKTLRILTEEILKLKGSAVRGPTTADEFFVADISSADKPAQIFPRYLNEES